MTLRFPLPPAALCAFAFAFALALPSAAAATPKSRAGEVIVRYSSGAHASSATSMPKTRVVKVRDVAAATKRLRKQRGVLSVTRNYIAHVSGWVPSDPGNTTVPGGWQSLQWNFLAETGVNAPEAWVHLAQAGRPGGPPARGAPTPPAR
jgi:serine protease